VKKRPKLSLLASTGALALMLAVVAVEPALAAEPSDIGKNVGNEVKAWATAIILGVAALVGIPALAKRNVGEAMSLGLVLLIVGMFAFAPNETKEIIKGVASAIAG
jgi:cobalamin synthase